MASTYTYDPSMITRKGKDQMRFELGDTVIQGGNMTTALCDEEYEAIITKYPDNWLMAKFQCLDAIVMRFAYEVDTKIDGLSYSLSDRYPRWKALYDDLKAELAAQNAAGALRADKCALKPPVFRKFMFENRRRF